MKYIVLIIPLALNDGCDLTVVLWVFETPTNEFDQTGKFDSEEEGSKSEGFGEEEQKEETNEGPENNATEQHTGEQQ